MNKSKIIPTIKKWLLMISMSLGIGGYFLILALDLGHETNHRIATVVTDMLPYLLFVMLFLEFSKIEPRDLFPKKWLWMVFAFQIVMAFVTIAIQKYVCMPQWTTAMWNGWLASMLSPTATAVAVMSSKLGGKAASATTYAVLSSLLAACAIPLIFPLASPQTADLSFWMLFTKIFAKVFPVIILPLMISLSLRKLAPKTHDFIAHFAKDKSFYLWSVCIMVNTAQVARLLFGGIAEGWVIGIYVVFGGLHTAIEYFIAGLILMITIIGIPFGLQSMKLGVLAIWPFGSKVKWKESQPGCLSMFMNVLWFFVGGFWICLTHIFYGLLLCITIIGIPWGKMHFRLAKLALSPFGMEVV